MRQGAVYQIPAMTATSRTLAKQNAVFPSAKKNT